VKTTTEKTASGQNGARRAQTGRLKQKTVSAKSTPGQRGAWVKSFTTYPGLVKAA